MYLISNLMGKTTHSNTRPWTKHKTWASLRANKADMEAYSNDRIDILMSDNLDWSEVIDIITPKLSENAEYIGLINADTRNKLYIEDLRKSPIKNGSIKSETTFGAIPSSMVNEFGNRPALFMFHTHPDDPLCCPLPSSQDLAVSILYGATMRFACSIVISRYGIIMYGVNKNMRVLFFNQRGKADWEYLFLNYSHDVIAGHESMRSWNTYSKREVEDFYNRYRMFFRVYPFSSYVSWDTASTTNIKNPIDYEIIQDQINNVMRHKYKYSKNNAKMKKMAEI